MTAQLWNLQKQSENKRKYNTSPKKALAKFRTQMQLHRVHTRKLKMKMEKNVYRSGMLLEVHPGPSNSYAVDNKMQQ